MFITERINNNCRAQQNEKKQKNTIPVRDTHQRSWCRVKRTFFLTTLNYYILGHKVLWNIYIRVAAMSLNRVYLYRLWAFFIFSSQRSAVTINVLYRGFIGLARPPHVSFYTNAYYKHAPFSYNIYHYIYITSTRDLSTIYNIII